MIEFEFCQAGLWVGKAMAKLRSFTNCRKCSQLLTKVMESLGIEMRGGVWQQDGSAHRQMLFFLSFLMHSVEELELT
jgi:hypothetical protein